MNRRDTKFPVCADWGRGGRFAGNGDVVDVGGVSSGAGDMTMSGVDIGEVGVGDHSGCVADGGLDGHGNRLPGCGAVGDWSEVSYGDGAFAIFGYSSEDNGWRGEAGSGTFDDSDEGNDRLALDAMNCDLPELILE